MLKLNDVSLYHMSGTSLSDLKKVEQGKPNTSYKLSTNEVHVIIVKALSTGNPFAQFSVTSKLTKANRSIYYGLFVLYLAIFLMIIAICGAYFILRGSVDDKIP